MHPGGLGVLVREVSRGNVFHTFAPVAVERSCEEFGLTARELEILRLVAGGLSNARIAAKLWVTEQTVKFHLSNVYRKLGVGNRTEASHHAHMHGLLPHAPGVPRRCRSPPDDMRTLANGASAIPLTRMDNADPALMEELLEAVEARRAQRRLHRRRRGRGVRGGVRRLLRHAPRRRASAPARRRSRSRCGRSTSAPATR